MSVSTLTDCSVLHMLSKFLLSFLLDTHAELGFHGFVSYTLDNDIFASHSVPDRFARYHRSRNADREVWLEPFDCTRLFKFSPLTLPYHSLSDHYPPYEEILLRLETIPGIQRRIAEILLAEIGPDMTRFPTAGHLASWAGMVRCITRLNIPGAARKNSKGGSWVNGLPHVERSWGTVACH